MFRFPGFQRTPLAALPSSTVSHLANATRFFSSSIPVKPTNAVVFTQSAKQFTSTNNRMFRRFTSSSACHTNNFKSASLVGCCAFSSSSTSTSSSVSASSQRGFFTKNTQPLFIKAAGGDTGAIQGVYSLKERTAEDEERDRKQKQQDEEDDSDPKPNGGYLPFPEPFHTINIMMLLLIGNTLMYFVMYSASDETRDWVIDNFTLSHENWHRIYPIFTHAFYQENLFQLAIDIWLLLQFGKTQLGFLGNTRLTFFWALCTMGGAAIHIIRQKVMLYYDMDPIEVRGRVFGPNPFILGLVGLEGLIFRNMNFLQNPPVPFLVLTAGVMIIDVWRIFTMKPEEHGSSTGGALVAYIMWALPHRMLGLDKLTAAI